MSVRSSITSRFLVIALEVQALPPEIRRSVFYPLKPQYLRTLDSWIDNIRSFKLNLKQFTAAPRIYNCGAIHLNAMSGVDDLHPVIHAGRVAVITGAASGIGKAAAREFAKLGLKVAIVDIDEEKLNIFGQELIGLIGALNVLIIPTDVSKLDQVAKLRDKVYGTWGEVAVLMNNAGIGTMGGSWGTAEIWHQVFDVNVFGIVIVQHIFVPSMLRQEKRAMILNTGSKRGITNTPGNAAYNASKAAVNLLTQSLAHELRERPGSNVSAHLLIPGQTWTGITGNDGIKPKPAGAWTAEETVSFMLDKVREGPFYVLAPDNDTKKEVDQLRIMWGAADIAEGRPALSRWHKDYKPLFEEFIRDGLAASDV